MIITDTLGETILFVLMNTMISVISLGEHVTINGTPHHMLIEEDPLSLFALPISMSIVLSGIVERIPDAATSEVANPTEIPDGDDVKKGSHKVGDSIGDIGVRYVINVTAVNLGEKDHHTGACGTKT